MDENKPIFVQIEEYEEVLETLSAAKAKLEDAKQVLGHIIELKEEEDNEIDAWKVGLDDVEKKLNFVDKALFEPDTI